MSASVYVFKYRASFFGRAFVVARVTPLPGSAVEGVKGPFAGAKR